MTLADLLPEETAEPAAEAPSSGTVSLGELERVAASQRPAVPFLVGAAPPPDQPREPIPDAPWAALVPAPPPPPRGNQQVTLALGDLFSDLSTADVPAEHPAEPPAAKDRFALRLACVDVPSRKDDRVPMVNPPGVEAISFPWQLRPPRSSLTVVVKQSCELQSDGVAAPRPQSEPVMGAVQVSVDEPEPRHPSDFVVFKLKADVVLAGSAHPKLEKGTVAEVMFSFGTRGNRFERRLVACGPRQWDRSCALGFTEPELFELLPLRWDMAFGGPGFAQNPRGMGHPSNNGQVRPPQLEDPQALVTTRGDRPAPICFAATGEQWSQRCSKRGSYDEDWLAKRWPYFPADFDWSYFQSAPRQQQLSYLQGDEPFEIQGVRPGNKGLQGRLPGLVQRCFKLTGDGDSAALKEVVLRLDTVAFDTDDGRVDLVWRGVFETSAPDAPQVRLLFIFQDPLDEPSTLEQVEDALIVALEQPAQDEPKPAAEQEPSLEAEPIEKLDDEELDDEEPDEQDDEMEVPTGEPWDSLGSAAALEAIKAAKPPDEAEIAATMAEQQEQLEKWREDTAALANKHGLGDGGQDDEDPEEDEQDEALQDEAEDASDTEDPTDNDPLDLAGVDLAGQDLRDRSLCGACLRGANLQSAQLDGVDLSDADLSGAKLAQASLRGAILTRAVLRNAELCGAVLAEAQLDDADFGEATATAADFRGASGERAQLTDTDLSGARFDGARLPAVDLSRARLDATCFEQAQLPKARFFEATGKATVFTAAGLQGAQADDASLCDAKLDGADAAGSSWERAKLDGATFHSASLIEACFVRCSCRATILSCANLTRARLDKADFSDAAFLKTNLMMASLEGALLCNADLRGSNLYSVASWQAKLDGANFELALLGKTQIADAKRPGEGR